MSMEKLRKAFAEIVTEAINEGFNIGIKEFLKDLDRDLQENEILEKKDELTFFEEFFRGTDAEKIIAEMKAEAEKEESDDDIDRVAEKLLKGL